MYRIVVLTNSKAQEAFFTERISRFCTGCEQLPVVGTSRDQEQLFETVQKTSPTNAVITLSDIDGLNTVGHLRAPCRNTCIIWRNNLNFSLHAFRLRADYLLLKPVTKTAFQQGFYAWLNEKNLVTQPRPNYTETSKEDYS